VSVAHGAESLYTCAPAVAMTTGICLVTGATGFVGSHLCSELVEAGYGVRAVVRHGEQAVGRGIERVTVPDIAFADWTAALRDVDCVVHLAGLAHQVSTRGRDRRDEFHRVNADATRRLAAAAAGVVRRVIYVSSVGAAEAAVALSCSDPSLGHPKFDYGLSKLRGEELLIEALRGSETDWCILRPPLVYGRGQAGNMARLQRLVRLGAPLPLGKVSNRRSLVYVGNLASAITTVIPHPAAARRIFVVCDSRAPSTPELILSIGHHVGRKVRLWPLPVRVLKVIGRAGDLVSRVFRRPLPVDTYAVQRLCETLVVDSSAFRAATGWQQPYSQEEGLRLTFGGSFHDVAPAQDPVGTGLGSG
jgi:nucleoside-diphosphate-sugar epimerase